MKIFQITDFLERKTLSNLPSTFGIVLQNAKFWRHNRAEFDRNIFYNIDFVKKVFFLAAIGSEIHG